MFSKKNHCDDYYPLSPIEIVRGVLGQKLKIPPSIRSRKNVWLKINLIQSGLQPCVELQSSESSKQRQFFQSKTTGCRLLNLSGIELDKDFLRIETFNCRLSDEVEWLVFPELEINKNSTTLILAPHPDDAEIAAYGFYKKRSKQVFIVTVSPGERLQSLKKQYIPFVDRDTASAEYRKAIIRSWNSATTPMLAGVSSEKLIMLGYYNLTLKKMLELPHQAIPHPNIKNQISPADFRQWNKFQLKSDQNSKNIGVQIVDDLSEIISSIKPDIILVPHPELDPHPDHIATTQALAEALNKINYIPDHVLLYANHFKSVKKFPFGPEHSGAGLPPAQMSKSVFGSWKLWSEILNDAIQREKIYALDTMHDLRHEWHFDKRLKAWFAQLWLRFPFLYYRKHPYFQTAIKSQEVFVWLSGMEFISGMKQFQEDVNKSHEVL